MEKHACLRFADRGGRGCKPFLRDGEKMAKESAQKQFVRIKGPRSKHCIRTRASTQTGLGQNNA
eukprot:4289427-Pleurochrysis_carterae.AAC.2